MPLQEILKEYEKRFPRAVEIAAGILATVPIGGKEFRNGIILQAVRNKRLRGEYKGAKELLDELLLEEGLVKIAYWDNCGRIFHDLGNFISAQECYETGLKSLENVMVNKESRRASLLNNLGHNFVVRDDGKQDFSIAEAVLLESKSIYEKIKQEEGRAYTLIHIGELQSEQKKYDGALNTLKESLGIEKALSNLSGIALAEQQIGRVLLAQGDREKAIDYLHRALCDIGQAKLCRRILAEIIVDLGKAASTEENKKLLFKKGFELYSSMKLYEQRNSPSRAREVRDYLLRD